MFGGQLSPTPMFWFPDNYKEECTASFLPFICVSVLNKISEVQLQVVQAVCGTRSSFRQLECLLWKVCIEFGGYVLCTWVCGMSWCTSWLQWKLFHVMPTKFFQFFLGLLLSPTPPVCSAMCSLMKWGAEGFRELWASTVLQRMRCCTVPWNASGTAEFHILSAFPKSGTQLQKSWQLSTLYWLGVRHLFLWKNRQHFKIA